MPIGSQIREATTGSSSWTNRQAIEVENSPFDP
jgi:hypothetical protein